MALQTRTTETRRGLIGSLLLAMIFMGLGLACVDRLIGDPASYPRPIDY